VQNLSWWPATCYAATSEALYWPKRKPFLNEIPKREAVVAFNIVQLPKLALNTLSRRPHVLFLTLMPTLYLHRFICSLVYLLLSVLCCAFPPKALSPLPFIHNDLPSLLSPAVFHSPAHSLLLLSFFWQYQHTEVSPYLWIHNSLVRVWSHISILIYGLKLYLNINIWTFWL
jgi:hypothetical protein